MASDGTVVVVICAGVNVGVDWVRVAVGVAHCGAGLVSLWRLAGISVALDWSQSGN